jgi:hypothetical protein
MKGGASGEGSWSRGVNHFSSAGLRRRWEQSVSFRCAVPECKGNRYAIIFERPGDIHHCLEVIAADPEVVVERANNRLSRQYDAHLTAGYRCASPGLLTYRLRRSNLLAYCDISPDASMARFIHPTAPRRRGATELCYLHPLGAGLTSPSGGGVWSWGP